MKFGEAEQEVGFGDETEGLGLIGGPSGKIRAIKADSKNKSEYI
jgi:U4/U6 small nuclear ribonucleoprotein PRP31